MASALSADDELAENNLHRDWWLCNDTEGEKGLILTLPDTLWVISGRNKLRWEGELADELKGNQFLLDNLSRKDSLEFLEQAGIKSSELREKIFKLTEGYPYLNICVDTYEQDPTIEDFGQDREKIIERILRDLNATERTMLQNLCALGKWTDEIVRAEKFNPHIYRKLKELFFIQSAEENFFTLEPTLQKILS